MLIENEDVSQFSGAQVIVVLTLGFRDLVRTKMRGSVSLDQSTRTSSNEGVDILWVLEEPALVGALSFRW